MTKKNIMPVVVLTAICVVVALLLAVVNMFTAPVIKANAERAELESLKAVMPEAEDFEELSTEGLPETVSKIYAETTGKGHVVLLKVNTSYSHGTPISVTVGIGADGKITGTKLTGYSESKDIGSDYPDKFIGLGSSEAQKVDTVTEVTVSSTAFKGLVQDAFAAVAALGGASDPLLADVNALLPDGESAELLDSPVLVGGALKVYKSTSSEKYVVLVNTKTLYVNPDTSTLFAIDAQTMKITGIKILEWNHGTGIGYTESFVNAFTGKGSAEIDGIDKITDATGTCDNVKGAAKDALKTVELREYTKEYAAAKELLGVEYPILAYHGSGDDGISCVWRDENANYAVTVSTKTQYVNPNTVSVIAVGNDDKVIGIKVVLWNHGTGIDYTDDFVNAFAGKDSSTVDSVPSITDATGNCDNIKQATKTALEWVKTERPAVIELLAEALIPYCSLDELSCEGAPEGVMRLWRDANGGGYVAFVKTKTEYVNPDTMTLVAVGNDGKVIGIQICFWKHGTGVAYTDEFVSSFNGKDYDGVDGVDTVTEATGTCSNVKGAVKTAIEAINAVKGGS